jgi:hypothetical protein
MQILNLDGGVAATADDTPELGWDCRLEWSCPADGDYLLSITDLHSRGGDDFVYTVQAREALPDFSLQADDDKAMIGPDGGYAMYVLATRRHGFNGEIGLSVENLPLGVTATAGKIPAGVSQGCVIFNAAPDAKPDFRRIRILGTGSRGLPGGGVEEIRRPAVPLQEIYLPGGGRGRYPVDTHVAAVTGPPDIIVKVSAKKLNIKAGGTASVDVTVERSATYKGNVILDVYLRHLGSKYGDPLPPGVSLDESASKTLLGPTEAAGKLVFRAAAGAMEVRDLPIAVLGQVSINFVVKVSHAGPPVLLTVEK